PIKTAIRPDSVRLLLPEDPWMLEELGKLEESLKAQERTLTGPAYREPLTIHSVEYGLKSGSYRPYTERVRGFVFANSLNVPVRNGTFGEDPFDNDVKRARIVYSLGSSSPRTVIRREYSQLSLPPD